MRDCHARLLMLRAGVSRELYWEIKMITLCKHVLRQCMSGMSDAIYEPNIVYASPPRNPRTKRKERRKPTVPDNSFHLPDLHLSAHDRVRFTTLDRVTHVFNTHPTRSVSIEKWLWGIKMITLSVLYSIRNCGRPIKRNRLRISLGEKKFEMDKNRSLFPENAHLIY